MKAEDIDNWLKNNPRKSSITYYSYNRRDGKLLAKACERNIEMATLANTVMRYVREGKAVAYQKFTPDVCEYIIKKI